MLALQPLFPHIPAVLRRSTMTSHRQAIERGHRTTAYQESRAALDREVDQFHQPAHYTVLQVDRGVIPTGGARIHHRLQELGQHPDGRACRVDPGGETRVLVAHGMRQDVLLEEVEERLGRPPVLRERLVEQHLAFGGRHRAEDGFTRNAFQIFGCQFHRQQAQVIKRVSIHRERRWVARRRQRSGRKSVLCEIVCTHGYSHPFIPCNCCYSTVLLGLHSPDQREQGRDSVRVRGVAATPHSPRWVPG